MGFTHQLTKVTLNVTKDETIETLNGLGVNIKGISTEGEFNLADGTLTATAGTNNKDVAMYIDAQGTTATATAIILPTAASTDQTSLNLTLISTVNHSLIQSVTQVFLKRNKCKL